LCFFVPIASVLRRLKAILQGGPLQWGLTTLGTKDLKNAIEQYIRQFNTLLDKSIYFKKGVFNYYNASQIAKSLSDHGFFKASHSLSLNADAPKEITNEKELEALIKSEKDSITSDATLQKKYSDISKILCRVDKMDSHGGLNVIQAGICDGDQLGTRPDVGRGVGVS
jgi:hypothetical protein